MSVLSQTDLSMLWILQRELCWSSGRSRPLRLSAVTTLDFGKVYLQPKTIGAF